MAARNEAQFRCELSEAGFDRAYGTQSSAISDDGGPLYPSALYKVWRTRWRQARAWRGRDIKSAIVDTYRAIPGGLPGMISCLDKSAPIARQCHSALSKLAEQNG